MAPGPTTMVIVPSRMPATVMAATRSKPATQSSPATATPAPPVQPPIIGSQMHQIDQAHGLDQAAEAGVYWMRFDVFHWDRIEPVSTHPPTFNWQAVDEASLRNATGAGMQVIAAVKFTPVWAQKVSGSYCGPIRQEALDEYAEFLTTLVKRYSQPPYSIQYWELGNEPDVDPGLVEAHSLLGCWGDENDPNYGGGYYAEMLKVAYPAIKAADPRAQVLIGGLLLDCDPTHPPQGKDCKPAKFLEGILANGGGNYFDIVSFHGYPLYDGSLQWDEHFPSWEARGGVVLGKIDFLREVMLAHGVNKPLMHTEGSLLCHPNHPLCKPPQAAFYETQADYVVWLFVRNWAQGLLGTVWYHFEGPGWRHGGMLDADQVPKPAYHALSFLSQELKGAVFSKVVGQYPKLRGYEFSVPKKRIWVLWAPDEQPHQIDLPTGVQIVYDKYGREITPMGSTISIQSPTYVELAP